MRGFWVYPGETGKMKTVGGGLLILSVLAIIAFLVATGVTLFIVGWNNG